MKSDVVMKQVQLDVQLYVAKGHKCCFTDPVFEEKKEKRKKRRSKTETKPENVNIGMHVNVDEPI